jgi:hypothetical protein
MADPVNPVSDEQANAAMKSLMGFQPDEDETPVQAAAPEPPTETPAEPEPATEQPAQETATTEAAQPTEQPSDDIESLRKRLESVTKEREEAVKAATERTEAIQMRSRQNETILRERLLKKSTAADRALKALEAARSQNGIAEADVDRIIAEVRSTMNPQSPSYVSVPEQPTYAGEDQALILNEFLNEKGLTRVEAESFGKWIKSEAETIMSEPEQRLAQRDLDGFLRVAHVRYAESLHTKERQRTETVGAVKAVQRAQRETARAGSSIPSAPRKQSTGANEPLDVKKLTNDDVSKLLRISVEQYK